MQRQLAWGEQFGLTQQEATLDNYQLTRTCCSAEATEHSIEADDTALFGGRGTDATTQPFGAPSNELPCTRGSSISDRSDEHRYAQSHPSPLTRSLIEGSSTISSMEGRPSVRTLLHLASWRFFGVGMCWLRTCYVGSECGPTGL
jgi:hypothetical protein